MSRIVDKKINKYIDQLLKKEKEDSLCTYIYDLKKLRDHAKAIKQSLPEFCRLYYAMKANPDKEILKVLHEIVDGFEAASGGEIQKVKEVSTKPIIFGAPAKKEYELEQIVQGEVQLSNIESFHEVNRIQYLAKLRNKQVSVVVRVNVKDNVSESKLKMAGVPTQFGIDEQRVPELLETIESCPNLTVKGFHFHAMSNNLDAQVHLNFIELCIQKVMIWKQLLSYPVSIVNVGGGIGINYTNPGLPFDWNLFSQGLHGFYKKFCLEGVEVLLELGRYLVAECGYYATEVLDIKENHGESFALIRGGSHHLRLPAAWRMNQPFTIYPVSNWDYPFPRPAIRDKNVTLAGELCTPNDVLARNVTLNELRVGDIIVFHFAGAYGWTISHRDFLLHPYPCVFYYEG